ncbi:uncharacterized protein HD556DRAFT_1444235 [Suillus plorans]|uniref:DNA repair protein Rev1 C-terminal domain-containing protein n=1 Tax=Suillus plorans TaxID=116603 RepID=A0A9P7AN85_9AGAM|nr:uncharacterized protein HD556DRAFT_1444235 [Suillus plorans]KAG1792841.1 hypothetical protein HD556DRAFT_1444235 [Suillus plorans]
MRVSDAELRQLDIDPDVENLLQKRKIIKASSRAPSAPYHKKPLSKAKHPESPLLKQQGKQPGEKSHFAETGGVQSVIESWVKGFTKYPPKQKDVDHVRKFLVQSVE